MSLKTATTIAIIGIVFILLGEALSLFLQLFVKTTVDNLSSIQSIFKVTLVLNLVGMVTLLIFFLSFLAAQKRRV